MKRPRTHRVAASSLNDSGRGARRSDKTKTIRSVKPATHLGEPIEHCYRTLLETSSSPILLLSPESIILGWNRAAETVSGWMADEALGRSYVGLCLQVETHESFLTTLAQVAVGRKVKGLEVPRSEEHTSELQSR